MRRVRFLGHSAGRTGAPIVLLHFLRWLREHTDWSFELTLFDGGELVAEYQRVCPTATLNATWLKPIVARLVRGDLSARLERLRLRRLRARLARSGTELLYANTITLGAPTAALASGARTVVTHAHEMGHWIERSGAENWARVRQHTRRFVAASSAVRKTLVGSYGIDAAAVDVVHEFIPARALVSARRGEDLRQALGAERSAFLVAGSGHETWRKGKDLFVELAARVVAARSERAFLFVWAGGWESATEEEGIRRRIEELGLRGRVRFLGHLGDPLELFSQADAFAMVSREDPFPLVCLEAAALGVPVLCFEGAGGTPELVESDAGVVVPHLDVAAMAVEISKLAREEPRRRQLGERAAAKVRERHDVDVAAPRIVEILETALGGSRAA